MTEEGTREILSIFNMSKESGTGWDDRFDRMRDRGLQRVGLSVADGIKGLQLSQSWCNHVAGGLLLSRAWFLVRLHSKLTIFA
ncbi:MAG: transposase [Muribaculaceae bacterium]|nr:transposase [Muribaculaceae bacterium]